MKTTAFIILTLLSTCCVWAQPGKYLEYDQIVDQLEKEVHKGQKRALRDLGSLLDKNEIDQKIRVILSNATFFTANEIDVNQSSKMEFLSFYYDNEQKIQYSELLDIFYITPLENRKISFEMKSVSFEDESINTGMIRRYFMDLEELLSTKQFGEVHKLIQKMASLKAVNKDHLLINLLQDERLSDIPAALRNECYENILKQLDEYPKIEIVKITLQLLEAKMLNETFATPLLEKTTNCQPLFQADLSQKISYYQNLIDSLETLEEIRRHGYEKIFKFNINFFQYPVDYYGKILGSSNDYPWIRKNALLDLKRSKHPRALFYIAADFYRTRKNATDSLEIDHVQLIKSRTNVEIGIQNRNGIVTFDPEKDDETAMLNYLIYWGAAYQDYEWDEPRKIFTSKMESFAKTQNYEKLFRRFNSKNDSIALLSFLQLTEGDPLEIITLSKKYRQLLRNHNNALPSMKYKYLEQLSVLTAFCRANNVSYKPDKKLLAKFEKLAYPDSEKERYLAENKLIESLSLDDITALEYWVCVHEKNENLSLSAGRILDWFYSKNWKTIIQDSDNLRLFLKKSFLFENIGVEGICNNYLNKFDLSNVDLLNQLHELGNVESDKDILTQILLLLEQEPGEEFVTYNIEDFIAAPLLFNQKDLKILPAPSLSELEEIVEIIQNSDDTELIKKLFSFLRLQSNIEYIPKLFRLIDDNRIVSERENVQILVADNIIPVVENIYSFRVPVENSDHPFATNFWKSLWEKDSTHYQQWGTLFYQQKLDSLTLKTQITIYDLNQMTEDPYYSENYKPIILASLKKVKPIKNIRRFNIQPKLSVTEDLKYFEDFIFTYKVLDEIPKLFEIDNEKADLMLDFLIAKSSTFNYSEKGSFFNNLFRSPWMISLINSGKLASSKTEVIKTAFKNYLDESSFLSEFEEQTTILNISTMENNGKDLDTKLLAVIQMDVDREPKAKILEEIIATISYAEISNILKHLDEISNILGDKTFTFLHRDFGLPIFNIKNKKEQEELIHKHQNLSEYEFYKHYLEKFGVDFLDKNDHLDFAKIYDILQFDVISPFASEGGGKRDEYTFGIIRLLEINFNTRLEFHEKLNEYQTFYSFSSSKRAEAWISYLQQNKLISLEQIIPSSFNQTRKERKTISNNSTNNN